jgi:2-polyprenyl-6-methoxyphenol hydroxylase-like FAD-dependent oxidoreductase
VIASVDLSFSSNYKYALLCEQWWTEKCLTNYLEKNGIKVQRGIEFVSLEETKDYVIIKTNNEEIVYHSQYVVGSDGAKSSFRKALGIKFIGEALENGFCAAHVVIDKDTIPETLKSDTLSIFLLKEGMSFITPMPDNTWIAAFDFTKEQEKDFLQTEMDNYGNQIQKEFTKENIDIIFQERISQKIKIEKIIWKSHFVN